MRKSYRFTISGHGAEGATFEATNSLLCEFADTFQEAMIDTFRQLTNGKAIYTSPGVGCRGPYTIKRVLIEELMQ